nr:choice-of-anchor Q domain-containing protein [uncultured Marinifilum sp.]
MRKSGLYIIVLLLIIISVSCDNEDGYNLDSDFRLGFSVDTLSFDTLFTGFGSTTKQFKVYNQSSSKVKLSRIFLYNENSPYRLNVNGIRNNSYLDIDIPANDSLFIFVEVDLEIADMDEARKLEDILVFEINEKLQGVILETYAQDVILYSSDIASSQNWTGKRPYLIEKSISVAKGSTLSIDEGAKIYFRKNAALYINGNLKLNGSYEKPIYFGSSRFEDLYKNVPGQWDGIYISESSVNCDLKHFTIENGINGISYSGSGESVNSLKLEYGIIKNFTQKGLSITNVDLVAHDILLANCGEECLNIEGESDVELYHSTIFNSWYYGIRTNSALTIANNETSNSKIGNSIVWGNSSNEISILNAQALKIENCLLRLSSSETTEYSSVFSDCIFNEDPLFTDVENFNFTLTSESPCINNGQSEYGNLYPSDLLGVSRISNTPDLGAYEFFE